MADKKEAMKDKKDDKKSDVKERMAAMRAKRGGKKK